MGMDYARECTLFDFSAIHLMVRMAERFTTRLLDELRERDIDLRTTPAYSSAAGRSCCGNSSKNRLW